MKKIIKNGMVAFILISLASNIQATPVTNVSDVEKMDLDYIKGGSKITVKDAKNKIIYTEVIKGAISFKDEFQLPNLGQGDYILEIERDFEIQVLPFIVKTKTVEFQYEKAYSIFKPAIKFKGKRVLLSRLSLDQEPLNVLVYDHKGELLHKEQIKNEMQMKRIYDFSKLRENKFMIVFKTKDRTFTENIKF